MSNKSSHSSPIKEDQEEEEEKDSKKDNFSQSQLEKIDSCQQEEDGGGGGCGGGGDREDKILSLGESVVAEDDEGFRTPTSSDHKIPVMTECPPAPKKFWPESSRKRKASPPRTRLSRRQSDVIVSVAEVESIFTPVAEEGLDRKLKKPRRDDQDDDED